MVGPLHYFAVKVLLNIFQKMFGKFLITITYGFPLSMDFESNLN